MTREEILALSPGRELNLLVATEVMGWIPWKETRGEYVYIVFQKPGEREPYMSHRDWKGMAARYKRVEISEIDFMKHIATGLEDFSEEISAAWEVMEKFESWQVTKITMTGRYRVIIRSNGNVSYADTAPEAICKAALLAVMNL